MVPGVVQGLSRRDSRLLCKLEVSSAEGSDNTTNVDNGPPDDFSESIRCRPGTDLGLVLG